MVESEEEVQKLEKERKYTTAASFSAASEAVRGARSALEVETADDPDLVSLALGEDAIWRRIADATSVVGETLYETVLAYLAYSTAKEEGEASEESWSSTPCLSHGSVLVVYARSAERHTVGTAVVLYLWEEYFLAGADNSLGISSSNTLAIYWCLAGASSDPAWRTKASLADKRAVLASSMVEAMVEREWTARSASACRGSRVRFHHNDGEEREVHYHYREVEKYCAG